MKIEEPLKPKNRIDKEDEIDLAKVFSGIYQSFLTFLKIVARFFFTFLDNIFAHLKIIGLLIVLGGGLGLAYFFYTKPYYESRMTLNSDYFKGELLDNSIQNLNEVCKEGNSKVLASLLKIPESKSRNIKSIKLSPVVSQNYRMLIELYSSDKKYQGKLDSLLLYNFQSNFQLNVEVYDTSALKGLDTILVNYIKTNAYVKKRIEIDRLNLINKKNKLTRESGSLDTLKRSIAISIRRSGDAGRSGTNNVILGEKTVNPIEIYQQDLELYNQRQEIDRQLALNAEIEVIEKFIPYSKPKSGSIVTNAAKGAVAGLIIAILYVLYQMLRDGLTRLRYSLEEEAL
ncbi:MAG: hypothetical protein ACO1O1_11180 [Adhaeribacter sp.]